MQYPQYDDMGKAFCHRRPRLSSVLDRRQGSAFYVFKGRVGARWTGPYVPASCPAAAAARQARRSNLRASLKARFPGPRPGLTGPNIRSTVDDMESAPAHRPGLSVVSAVPEPAACEVSGAGTLLVLPALRELLPRGGLVRGSVVSVAEFGVLALALLAGASADGAWCAITGVPQAGILAAAELGLDPERTLLVPDPGDAWPEVVASLLDGCELVLLRPPLQPAAPIRKRLEATLRRRRGVLLIAGDWPGVPVRLRVTARRWAGLGDGHGRLRACLAEVVADGRGEAAVPVTRWLWPPAEDGSITVASPVDIPRDGWARRRICAWSARGADRDTRGVDATPPGHPA
jgi:hypothetical protein